MALRQPVEIAEANAVAACLLTPVRSYPIASSAAIRPTVTDRTGSAAGGYAAAYILIAQMYASSAGGIFQESEKQGLVFAAAVDKLQRAKSVDPSVTSEANKLINQYSRYYMDKETAFMMGMKEGETVHVPGWIGETTTIRTK